MTWEWGDSFGMTWERVDPFGMTWERGAVLRFFAPLRMTWERVDPFGMTWGWWCVYVVLGASRLLCPSDISPVDRGKPNGFAAPLDSHFRADDGVVFPANGHESRL